MSAKGPTYLKPKERSSPKAWVDQSILIQNPTEDKDGYNKEVTVEVVAELALKGGND